jgi:hypothetical protein
MNALQPKHDPTPSQPSRLPRVRSRSRQTYHRELAAEAAIKLCVNCVLASITVATLFRLIPSNLEQQADLKRLQGEVSEADIAVSKLENDFDRHFDPQQSLNVMQEQNIRFNPKQRQIVWLNPQSKPAETTAAQP